MKIILAPVDFSDASMNAVAFAAELAKASSARLVIVNIFQKGADEKEAKDKLNSMAVRPEKIIRSCIKLRIINLRTGTELLHLKK